MGVSRRAYARHRGVSEMAVRKAIASGRLVLEADGTIDLHKADVAWASRSDPNRARGPTPSPPRAAVRSPPSPPSRAAEATANTSASERPVPLAAVEAVRETLREHGEPAPAAGGMTFVQARTANEVIKAQERRIRLGKLKGDLVDRARAVATVFALARRERDAWVQWPARVAALIAAELQVDPHPLEQALETHVRRHLEELAGIALELR